LIKALVVTHKFCFEVQDLKSNLVVIMGVERYDGTEKRFVDYSIADVLQMQGLANTINY
jgi:pre-mRNA-splicing helicase BRR2